MDRINLDFETWSECDIKSAGAYRYGRHPSTEITSLAWSFDDEPVAYYLPWGWFLRARVAARFGRAIPLPFPVRSDIEYHAHNAAFERIIWREVCVRLFGWPDIPLRQWHCTAARVARLALPRALGGACKSVGTKKQKDADGRVNMLALAKPRKPTKTDPRARIYKPDKLRKLYAYNCDDVFAERSLSQCTPGPQPYERAVWLLDQKINDRGIPVDRKTVRAAVAMADKLDHDLVVQIRAATNGEVGSPNEVANLKSWLIANGCALTIDGVAKPNVQADTIAHELTLGRPEHVRRVLQIRQAGGLSSIKKFRSADASADIDDRIRGSLLYHGGTTGRWAGKGFQPHNLKRASPKNPEPLIEAIRRHDVDWIIEHFGELNEGLSQALRPTIQAQHGRFLVADFAGIENCVTAWLANETAQLQTIRRNGPGYLYLEMAAEIYGQDVATLSEWHRTEDERLGQMRQIGKAAILGLGFQMGGRTFQQSVFDREGVELDLAFADQVVATYRAKYGRIKSFWYNLQDAAIGAVKNPGKVTSAGLIRFKLDGRYLFAQLPSGRHLTYVDPVLVMESMPWDVDDKRPSLRYFAVCKKRKTQWVRTSTYGGRLCENVVQATARDLLVEAMFRVERQGYPIVFHVHDELIAETSRGSIEEFNELMAVSPRWAQGCPISVVGHEKRRYSK